MEEQLLLIIKVKDQISGVLKGIERNLGSLGNTFRTKIGEGVKQLTNLAAVAATAAAGIATFGLKTAADLETAEQGFVTLLGSAQGAREAMDRIKLEAKRTPFELPGLVQATQLLTSVTKEAGPAIDFLLDIGESLAAMGKGQGELDRIIVNLQQIGAVGKASMLDIKQFAFAGIPIFELLQEKTGLAGEALEDFIKEGGVTFELLQDLFRDATEEGGRFFGAFANQSGTLTQLVSNLKDNFVILGAEIVTESGLFDLAKQAVKTLNNWFETSSDTIIRFATVALNTLRGILVGVKTLLFDTGTNAAELSEILEGIIPPSVVSILLTVRDALGRIFEVLGIGKEDVANIVKVMGALVGTFVSVAGIIRVLTNPLTILGFALAAIGTAVVILKKMWDENTLGIRDTIQKVGGIIGKVFDSIGKAINDFINSPFVQNLIKIFKETVPKIIENVQKAFDGLKRVFEEKIIPAIQNLIDAIRPFIETIAPIIEDVITFLVTLFLEVARVISEVLQPVLTFIGEIIAGIINFIAELIRFFTDLINIAITIFEEVRTVVENVWNGIRDFIQGIIEGIGNIINGIVEIVTNIFNSVKGEVERIWEEIKKFIQGVIDSITGIIGGVIDTVGTLINDIKKALGLATELRKAELTEAQEESIRTKREAFFAARKAGEGFQTGADFIVPTGFPNDTFPFRVTSGERVQVTPANEVNNNQRSVNIETVNVNNNMDFEMFKNTLLFNLR